MAPTTTILPTTTEEITTTVAPTTTNAATTTAFTTPCTGSAYECEFEEIKKECAGLKIDLVFVVDGSSSVGLEKFLMIQQFLITVPRPMDVDPGGTRVAMVQYSSFPRV